MRPGIVITAYNEARSEWRERDGVWGYEDALSERFDGNGVLSTLYSVGDSGAPDVPTVIVDDGSTDGCCDAPGLSAETIIRHEQRIGIGYSRREGVDALPADVDAVMFLDAHMRLSPGCLDHCAKLALEHNAVVWPDTRGLRDRPRFKDKERSKRHGNPLWTGHGARALTKPSKGETHHMFRSEWISDAPVDKLSRTHALVSPGYTIPRSVWSDIRTSKLARGFGANEPSVYISAMFADVPILHTCGAMVRHLFRSHTAHYTVSAREVYRNMAIVAKRCFSQKTWDNYWHPELKSGLDDDAERALVSDEFMAERAAFQKVKKRPDVEFWRGLVFEPVPEGVE
jgi:glycosyltransferase involved in cell wall biosynthesis